MSERSKHQQKLIRNYYENRDAIALQRAQELVTELYLSSGKSRAKHWRNLSTHLQKLGVADSTIEHLVSQDNPELVANLITKISQDS